MLFFSALLIGFMTFVIVMSLNRVFFHNKPTPLPIVLRLVACATCTYVFGMGVAGEQWGVALAYLLSTYIGIGLALSESGDLHYYRVMYQKPHEETAKAYAAEDDPNWSTYRPNE